MIISMVYRVLFFSGLCDFDVILFVQNLWREQCRNGANFYMDHISYLELFGLLRPSRAYSYYIHNNNDSLWACLLYTSDAADE